MIRGNSARPHETVAERLISEARERGLTSGARLPSVRELAKRYRVAKGTVQQAFGELVRDGLCYMVERKGLFLAKTPPEAEPRIATVGLVLNYERYNEEDNPFYRSLFEGAEMEAVRLRHNVLSLCGWRHKSRQQKGREIEQFRRELSGFVALGLYDEGDCLRLRDSGVPVAAVDFETRDLGIDCVVIDNRQAMDALCARVLAAADGEVLLVDLARATDYDPAIRERREAFLAALATANRPAGPQQLVYLKIAGGTPGDLDLARRALRPGRARPAAICMDEYTARTFLQQLGQEGSRPDRDFLLAYLGNAQPQYPDMAGTPALIGAVDFRALGGEGVKLLEERIAAGPGRAVRRTVGATIIEWSGRSA